MDLSAEKLIPNKAGTMPKKRVLALITKNHSFRGMQSPQRTTPLDRGVFLVTRHQPRKKPENNAIGHDVSGQGPKSESVVCLKHKNRACRDEPNWVSQESNQNTKSNNPPQNVKRQFLGRIDHAGIVQSTAIVGKNRPCQTKEHNNGY